MNKWYLTLQNIFSSSSSSLFLQQLNFSISDTSSSDFAYILPYLQATFVFIVIYVLTNIYIYIDFIKYAPFNYFFQFHLPILLKSFMYLISLDFQLIAFSHVYAVLLKIISLCHFFYLIKLYNTWNHHSSSPALWELVMQILDRLRTNIGKLKWS